MPELPREKVEYLSPEESERLNRQINEYGARINSIAPDFSSILAPLNQVHDFLASIQPALSIAQQYSIGMTQSINSALVVRNDFALAVTQFNNSYSQLALSVAIPFKFESAFLDAFNDCVNCFAEMIKMVVEAARSSILQVQELVTDFNHFQSLLPETINNTYSLPLPRNTFDSYEIPEIDLSYIEEKNAREERFQESVIALASSLTTVENVATEKVADWPASMGWKRDGKTFQVSEGVDIKFTNSDNKRCLLFKSLTQFRGAWAEVKKLSAMTGFPSDEVRQLLSHIRDERIKGKPAGDYIAIECRDSQPGAYRILVTPII